MISPSAVIVVIDDDPKLLELLAQSLSGPGRVVDTICGRDGLSADLIVLSQPTLVMINPNTPALSLDEMEHLIREVRKSCQSRFVIMTEGKNNDELVQKLGADGSLSIRLLLRDPLANLAASIRDASLLKEPEVQTPSTSLSALSDDAIMSLELDLGPRRVTQPQPVREVNTDLSPFQNQAPIIDLSSLIEEELRAHHNTKHDERYDIQIDTLGDHNVYCTNDGIEIEGLFISTALLPKVGTPVVAKITFPWGDKVELVGPVDFARADLGSGKRRKSGIGVKIAHLPEEQRAYFARFAELRAPYRIS